MERIPPETTTAIASSLYNSLNISQRDTSSDFTQPILDSASHGVIISAQAKDVGKLYNELKATGDEEALAGFREVIQNLAGNLDNQALTKLVDFGKEAVEQGETEAFANLLSVAHELNEEGKSSLSMVVVREAGNTYSDQGFEMTVEFAQTARSIMDMNFTTTKENISTIQDFVTTWRNIRTQEDSEQEEIEQDLQAFATQTRSTEADEMEDYLEQVNENIGTGNDISDYT